MILYIKINTNEGRNIAMEKKNYNWIKIFSILLLLVMLVLMLIVGTYAKYTTEVEGSDSAVVAKWAWQINDDDVSKNDTEFAFNLFDTIKDTADGNNETDVKATKIAPGTMGAFEIKVENLSEVNANYNLTLKETKGQDISDAKIEYSIIGTDKATDWTTDINTFNLTNTMLDMETGSKTLTVYWRWVYSSSETQNDIDTAVGFAAANSASDVDKTITIEAMLNFTQVD